MTMESAYIFSSQEKYAQSSRDGTMSMSTSSSSTSGCISGDDTTEISYAPSPSSKIMRVDSDASSEELKNAIKKYKNFIFDSNRCSDERKWLVRHLVELRLRVQQLEDQDDSPPEPGVAIMGHHFEICNSILNTKKKFCDRCCGIIWSVLQGAYICKDCDYICHIKCVDEVSRICAHIIATEKGELERNICPELGLSVQKFECAECKIRLRFHVRWNEPRLCDYSGLYYCSSCHWNDLCEIPARIVHNWDWEKRHVSRAAYQLLKLTKNIPLLNLESINEKLFNFVIELDFVRKLRKDTYLMMKYLVECQQGNVLVTREILNMLDTPKLYSVEHLELAKNGMLANQLSLLVEKCREHITDCQVCSGKAYLCELCGNDETIFPYDSNAIGCEKCNSYFHRVCWVQKQQDCPKCIRVEKRNKTKATEDDIYDFNS